jgi:hypothetical protein
MHPGGAVEAGSGENALPQIHFAPMKGPHMDNFREIVLSLLEQNINNRPRHLEVFTSWHLVVDKHLASIATPHKVVTAGANRTLVLMVAKGHALEIQHESLKILQKVNEFLGEKTYFSGIKVIQKSQDEQSD